jgi:hypothetical protein
MTTIHEMPATVAEPVGAWSVSCVRRTMDGQRWYRIVSENGWEIAYVPFGDRTTAEYRRCTEHARLIAAAPELLAIVSALDCECDSYHGHTCRRCDALKLARGE